MTVFTPGLPLVAASRAFPERDWTKAEPVHVGTMSDVFRVYSSDGHTLIVKLIGDEVDQAVKYQTSVFNRSEELWYRRFERNECRFPRPRLHYAGKASDLGITAFLVFEDRGSAPLSSVHQGMDHQDRTRVAYDLGTVLSEIHSSDIGGFSENDSAGSWAKEFINLFTQTVEGIMIADPAHGSTWSACGDHVIRREHFLLSLSRLRLVHGDFTAGNVLVGLRSGRYHRDGLSIIDWEWATLGDPNLDYAAIRFGVAFGTPGRLTGSTEDCRRFWDSYWRTGAVRRGEESPERQEIYMLYYLLAPLLAQVKLRRWGQDECRLASHLAQRILGGTLDLSC